jgi:transcriptional regulator with XRE-family HTH domain
MKLRQLRKELGLTQEELGSKIGQKRSNISKYENGFLEPGIDTLKKLAKLFNVSIDYLLDETNIRTPYSDEVKETIAAHHDGEWTEEELAEIEKFKEFIKLKRNDE